VAKRAGGGSGILAAGMLGGFLLINIAAHTASTRQITRNIKVSTIKIRGIVFINAIL
jgi:hypothetical protein